MTFSALPLVSGKVYLVGAGPGDPGLLTLRGLECLKQAELILYDYLVNPAMLRHAAPGSEQICLGHHHSGREMTQAEVNRLMIEGARLGKRVVRLKGGDPSLFGRGGEEADALLGAGIAFEVVPGVTAALAAASYAGIPITHRDYASAVAFVTGHPRREKGGASVDFASLASFPGTLVFYMGVRSASDWSKALIEEGKSGDTPVAIVRRCSWADQETICCRLEEVVATIAERDIRPPALVVVGEAVRFAHGASWFTSRPLFGETVLITRPSDENHALEERLLECGAEVLFQPAIEISEPEDWEPVDEVLTRLESIDWIVFSSANGVRYFFERLFGSGFDTRSLGGISIAAIGQGTADELNRYHLRADLIPAEFRAESLAESLKNEAPEKRFLLIRASRGREVLPEMLSAFGAIVEQVVAYRSSDVTEASEAIRERLHSNEIDWITVTSSSIARSLVKMFGEDVGRAKLASISPVTSGVLRELGLEVTVEASPSTLGALAEAIEAFVVEDEGKRK